MLLLNQSSFQFAKWPSSTREALKKGYFSQVTVEISPLHSLIGIVIVTPGCRQLFCFSGKGMRKCKNRPLLRLRLSRQRSNEFQSKTESATVADDGHHP